MKHFILSFLLAFSSNILFAQTNINIDIYHMLGDEPATLEKSTQNDMGENFYIDRLDYYLDDFIIVHDGGLETKISESIQLIRLSDDITKHTVSLGEQNVSNIEQIKFRLGIDKANNHADPAKWDPDHPLAPKYPSMHWGWTAGYRFFALEGMCGENVNQELQLHCIGDQFYQQVVLDVIPKSDGNSILIELNADYTQVLSEIKIGGGIIIHGDQNEMKDAASNFVNKVFSDRGLTNTNNVEVTKNFVIYPNPSTTYFKILAKSDIHQGRVHVYDINGKLVCDQSLDKNVYTSGMAPGVYFANITNSEGQVLESKKIIIQ